MTFSYIAVQASMSTDEKLEAIVKNGFLNRRYKDFYDIYVLSGKYPFNFDKLHNAVTETLANRRTPMTMDTVTSLLTQTNTPVTEWDPYEGCWK